jgi:hypothetical protein
MELGLRGEPGRQPKQPLDTFIRLVKVRKV